MTIIIRVKRGFYQVVVIALSKIFMFRIFCISSMMVGLVACQNVIPMPAESLSSSEKAVLKTGIIPTPDGIVITPYDYPEIQRQKVMLP